MAEEAEVQPEPVQPLTEQDLEVRQQLYDEIWKTTCNADQAKLASLTERKAKIEAQEMDDAKSRTLTYGEVDMGTLHTLLNKIKTDHGPLFEKKGIFLDLGSGCGKACIAAGLLHPFEKVVGIEVINSLGDFAATALGKYQDPALVDPPIDLPLKADIEFIKGDFVAEFEAKLEPLASQVVVALACAACWGEDQIQAMGKFASKMPGSSIFITFTQGLPEKMVIDENRNPAQRRQLAVKKALSVRGVDPATVDITVPPPENDPLGWREVHREDMQMMWGPSTCFIYQKVPDPVPEEPAEPAAE